MVYFNRIYPDKQTILMKKSLAVIPIVIYTRKNFFLLDALNEKIDIFKTAGLIEYWFFKNYNFVNVTAKRIEGPKKLTVDKLAGCFQILSFGCTISFVIFIIEVIIQKNHQTL